jgi:hypothetical protein
MSYFATGPIPAAQLEAIVPRIKVKSADESVTSSTTLQDDDDLLMPVAANTDYLIDGMLYYLAAQAGDITVGWTYPSGATLTWGGIGAIRDYTGAASGTEWLAIVADASSPSSTTDFGGNGSLPFTASYGGVLSVGANAGTLQLQWAQRASSGTATTVYARSWLRVQQVVSY